MSVSLDPNDYTQNQLNSICKNYINANANPARNCSQTCPECMRDCVCKTGFDCGIGGFLVVVIVFCVFLVAGGAFYAYYRYTRKRQKNKANSFGFPGADASVQQNINKQLDMIENSNVMSRSQYIQNGGNVDQQGIGAMERSGVSRRSGGGLPDKMTRSRYLDQADISVHEDDDYRQDMNGQGGVRQNNLNERQNRSFRSNGGGSQTQGGGIGYNDDVQGGQNNLFKSSPPLTVYGNGGEDELPKSARIPQNERMYKSQLQGGGYSSREASRYYDDRADY